MRLGEIKNIISKVLNEENEIIIDHKPVYTGQAQIVSNYGDIVSALGILLEAKWNTETSTEILEIIDTQGKTKIAELEATKFNHFKSYISAINQKLPFYYSILETMVEEQDEKTINIKIPTSNIHALSTLGTLNSRIHNILKKFNVDGEFRFVGFDKGSDWYVIVSVGTMSHAFVLACLKIAKLYFETREVYFKSEKARLDYFASLEKIEDQTEDGFAEYAKKRKQIEMEESIRKAVDEMGVGNSGKTPEELKSQLIIATTDLVKELGHGTEFHMSLNPPSYASGENQSFSIDYKKVRELTMPTKEAPKLEEPENKENNDESND